MCLHVFSEVIENQESIAHADRRASPGFSLPSTRPATREILIKSDLIRVDTDQESGSRTVARLTMYQPPASSPARAFRRIHGAVAACCWTFGVCLGIQLVVWALISFTAIRVEQVVTSEHEGAVVSTDDVRPQSVAAVLKPGHGLEMPEAPPVETKPSAWNERLGGLANFTGGIGTIAGLLLAPLAALGVVLAISLSVIGCERAASAMIGMMLISLGCAPLARNLPTVQFEGLFLPYSSLATAADGFASGEMGAIVFFARHLLLPLVALMTVVLCAMRFRDGVENGMFSREIAEADAALEREASNVSATSLRGAGRAASALGRVARDDDDLPSATKVSPGEMPRRLI